MRTFLKFIGHLMVPVLLLTVISTPKKTCAEEFKARWIKRAVSNYAAVTAPAELWSPMIRVKKQNVGRLFSYEYRNNDKWMTMGREEAALIPGFTSAQLSSLMTAPMRGSAFVFARYVPKQSELVINVIKVEEGGDGYITVYQTYFSPFHGEHWAASRAFLTDGERMDLGRAGRNPFASFLPSERSDPAFHNIGWDAAMVSVGLAMQYYHAVFAILNVENLRMESHKTTSGGFFHKKTTIHVNGYAVPSWFVALPTTIQSWGTSAAICVVPTPTVIDPATGQPSIDPVTGKPNRGECPDPKLVAYSGVSFDEWKGGSFPMDEEHIYHWEKTQGGFTVMFFTILIMVAAFFAGPEIYAALQGGGIEATTISGAQAAFAAGSVYAGGSLVTSGGPASLTDIKHGAFGSVGDGTRDPTSPGSNQERDATSALVQRHIEAPLNNLLQSPQGGLNAATPDPSSAVFGSGQQALRERARYCENLGLSRDQRNQCIVPPNLPIEVPE